MRLDAHQHFWQYSPVEHTWMSEGMAALKRDYLPEQLEPLLKQIAFDGCIAVQARQSLEETRWLLSLAAKHSFIHGVVGWIDLRSPALLQQLEEFSASPKLVAVRHVLHDEIDDNFMLRPDFHQGIAHLHNFGLAYDLLLFPRHLAVASQLVEKFPQQQFVLDHIGKPQISSALLSPWQEDLRKLAQFKNVSCKLSGMVTEARWNRWQADDFRRYLDVVLDAFGSDRLLIGSDWPVCTLSATYSATMKIVIDYIDKLSGQEQDAILGGNCARIYRAALRPRSQAPTAEGELPV